MADFKVMARRVARRAGWLVLLALALPVWADDDDNNVAVQIDRQVDKIVNQVKPSVVSVRVGSRNGKQTFAPAPSELWIENSLSVGQAAVAEIVLCGSDSRKKTAQALAGPNKLGWEGSDVLALLQPTRVGTGFVIDRDGVVLTTADVVGGSREVTVQFSDGREVTGKVLGADGPTGVAVLKVEVSNLPALRLAEKDGPKPGQLAIIVGNQLDRAGNVWRGTVARTDAVFSSGWPNAGPRGRLIQIDAPVGPGASGAPVLNLKGEVVGMVCATSNPWLRSGQADAAAAEKMAADLARKFGENPELQERVKRLSAAAEQLGQKAGAKAAALAERKAKEARKSGKDEARIKEEQERQAEEIERRMEQWGDQLDEKMEAHGEKIGELAGQLGEKLAEQAMLKSNEAADGEKGAREREAERRRLETEIRKLRQELRREQQEMNRELSKINELLPTIPGARDISIELQPDIAKIVAEAMAVSEAAIAPLLEETPDPQPDPKPAPDAKPAPDPQPAPDGAPLAISVDAAPSAAIAGAAPEIHLFAGPGPGQGAATYAIPASTARWAAMQLREHGRVAHPYLGLQVEDLKPEARERLKAPPEAHVRVAQVAPDGPSQAAGLQTDDLILEFQGKKPDDAADLVDLLRQAKVGDPVSLVVWRGGERHTVQVTLREQPQPSFRFGVAPIPPFPPGNFTVPSAPFPAPAPRVVVPRQPTYRSRPPRIMRVFPAGQVSARAEGRGRSARVTLEAQEAELEAVLRELSRATGLSFSAEESAAHRQITLKVEGVPVDDLVESLSRLYHLRSDRRGETITFRAR
jgi:S1-C subfamily serine protease